MHIKDIQKKIHQNAKDKGFWDEPINFGTFIALCHSELSEALEEDRKGEPSIYFPYATFKDDLPNPRKAIDFTVFGYGKPEGIAIELADCIIRILDYCEHERINIEDAIRIKHAYNKTRPYKHGKEY